MDSSSTLTDAMMRATTTSYGTVMIAEARTDKKLTANVASRNSSKCCQFRLLLYLMMFLSRCISYALRVSLSQALVAMVNHTSHHKLHNASVVDDRCPRDQHVNATFDDVIRGGEFDWNRNSQCAVLAAFYYGYALIQVPSGWLADRFGGMWVMAGSMAVESVLAMLIPTAAHLHVAAVIALRAMAGVFDGVQYPTAISLIAGIAPATERSRVVAFIMSGTSFGSIVGMLLGGVLCDYAGWPWVFYTFGVAGHAWAAAWILRATGQVLRRTPCRQILTSRQVWACVGAYTATMWGFITTLTCLPMYLSDVFGSGMTENGFLSMLPYIADGIMVMSSGQLADLLLRRGGLSTGLVRKTISAVGMLMSGLFIVLPGALDCRRVPIVACLVVSVGMMGFSRPNIGANTMDLSRSDAGILMGLANAVSNAVSILAPQVVGALTYGHHSRTQWTKVFAIVAAINVVGATVFVVFGSGRRQKWAATNVSSRTDVHI